MDWMSGYSMSGLAKQWVFDPFRLFFSDEFIELYMVHIIGLLFDLFEGFLLLFDKTRPVALFFGCMFHLMNSQMFHIGMFPWTMLATMPFFLRSDWPRRLSRAMPSCLSLFLPQRDDPKVNTKFTNEKNPRRKQDCKDIYVSLRKYFLIGVASIYVIIQLFLPWSHFITKVSMLIMMLTHFLNRNSSLLFNSHVSSKYFFLYIKSDCKSLSNST